jgi:hypothetical protein
MTPNAAIAILEAAKQTRSANMQSETEGTLIAGYCLTLSFLSGIQAKGIFTNDEIAHLYDSASLTLAELSPALMSPDARVFANGLLEKFARKIGPTN